MKAWRSTDKIMPPEEVDVIAVTNDGNKIIANWDGENWCDTNFIIYNQSEIIYWMPIPILPNE